MKSPLAETTQDERNARLVNTIAMHTRIVLVVLAALLALPSVLTGDVVTARQRSRTVTRTFRNTAPMNLPISDSEHVSASLYPSPIEVSGLKGTIRDVNLTLDNFSHQYPNAVQVLLVGPRGQTAMVMAYVGGSNDVSNVTLRLDDAAAAPLPDETQLRSGTFRPTNAKTNRVILFPAPAPLLTTANAALSVFDSSNPNGTWRLYVFDDDGEVDSGAFAGGWRLELQVEVKAKKKKR
jgi:subtilisin-like proprotein convertase family protein